MNSDAEVELKDNTDSTALHWAADYGYADIVQLLLDAGADVHAQGMWRGALPIYLAARQGHTASVKVLAGRTAHMNRSDLWNQSTALHMAAEGGHTETVEFLLQKGCRLDVVDRFNTTAQDCGTRFDVRELIRQTRVLRVATRHIHGASLHSTFLAWRELAAETKVSRLTDAKETWKLIFSLYSSDERKLYYRMWHQWEIRQRRKLKLEVEGKEWVVDRLRETKIFNELSERTLFALAEAMSVAKFRGGHRIMTQGDMGDNFYVLCQGVCEIQINNKEKGTVTRIKVERGATFGELALLQDVPRAATIVTLSNCMLMSLDKLTFQMGLVRNPSAADSSNRVKESFLAKVSLFSGLEGYSRVLLADLMTRESFLDKENIIEQGDLGDKFFIVEEGEAVASIMLPGMSKPKLVRQYSAGDFFGEIALIEDKPRKATVTAVGYLKCVVMDRARFQQLPASIQESLEDHVKTYSGRGAGAIERKAWIVAHLKKCRVFDNVRDRTLYALAGAMFQLRKGPDEVVFNQGDEGDNFYLILEGNCEVRIQMGDRLKKMPLSKGAFFGELALLHNKPRAGAIVTTSSTVLLGLDRQTFQLSQKSQMEERQNSKIISETFLAGVSIFSDVPSHELVLIADLMYRKEFQANTPIARQGEMGDCFYIILRGQAFASIEGVGSVRDYEPGDYFGEIALMKSVERQASVVAKTRAVCAVLDKSEFQGLPKSVKQKMEEKLYQYGVLEPEVAEEMVEELKYSFSIVDVDGGGDIDFNELKMAARALGLEPTVQELQAMLRAMDEDGGGTVDLDEFVSAVSKEIRRRCKKEAALNCRTVPRRQIRSAGGPRGAFGSLRPADDEGAGARGGGGGGGGGGSPARGTARARVVPRGAGGERVGLGGPGRRLGGAGGHGGRGRLGGPCFAGACGLPPELPEAAVAGRRGVREPAGMARRLGGGRGRRGAVRAPPGGAPGSPGDLPGELQGREPGRDRAPRRGLRTPGPTRSQPVDPPHLFLLQQLAGDRWPEQQGRRGAPG